MSDNNKLSPWRVSHIAKRMRHGAVIAYPVEGVWGLGCLPEKEDAVSRILTMKQRSRSMGLILIAAGISQFESFLYGLATPLRKELEQVWPAAVTFLVPDNGVAPLWIKGQHDRVALRVSPHTVVRQLCNALGGPIVSTSANPGGRSPALTPLRVRQYFSKDVDLVVPGKLGASIGASEIRDLVSGEIIRPGQQEAVRELRP